VSLTVSSGQGSDVEVKSNFIDVIAPQPLEAVFSTDPSRGAAPLNVQFTDESPGTPTTWTWDFGDGATSTEQNPTHVFASIGSFDVALSVANDNAESDATTVFDAVVVTDEVTLSPVADAYLRSGQPTRNYGDETFLRIRNAANGYRSLLKFDVANAGSQPVTAVLRMFVTDGSPHAGDLYLVGNSWNESSATARDGAGVMETDLRGTHEWVRAAAPRSAHVDASLLARITPIRSSEGTVFVGLHGDGEWRDASPYLPQSGVVVEYAYADLFEGEIVLIVFDELEARRIGPVLGPVLADGESATIRLEVADGRARARVWRYGAPEPSSWDVEGVTSSDNGTVQIAYRDAVGQSVTWVELLLSPVD
jgi:PKD repeat protein